MKSVLGFFVLCQMAAPFASAESAYTQEARLRLPGGSYQHTCDVDSCEFEGRYLRCYCRRSSGRWDWSQVYDWGGECGGNVENLESRLACERR